MRRSRAVGEFCVCVRVRVSMVGVEGMVTQLRASEVECVRLFSVSYSFKLTVISFSHFLFFFVYL